MRLSKLRLGVVVTFSEHCWIEHRLTLATVVMPTVRELDGKQKHDHLLFLRQVLLVVMWLLYSQHVIYHHAHTKVLSQDNYCPS